jgi:F420-dependent oxidoreductase-like protein
MRLGTLIRGSTIDEIVAHVRDARQAGFRSAWITDGRGMEPLTTLAVVGAAVGGIELGTAVVRTYPRHPMALAQQALTVNAVIGGRLALGIGPSHKPSVERDWGMAFDRPVRHIREHLSILVPLLDHASVSFDGQSFSAHATLDVTGGQGCPVLVGALGPQMLHLAGRMASGAITFMTGPRTLTGFTCPTLRRAAEEAGRPAPRVVCLLALCVTDDVAAAHRRAAELDAPMARLPSYSATLAREEGPALLAGSERQLDERLGELADAGVTDLVPIRFAKRGTDDDLRTTAWVRTLLADQPPAGLDGSRSAGTPGPGA